MAVDVNMAVPALLNVRFRNTFAAFVSPISSVALAAMVVTPAPLIVPPVQFMSLVTDTVPVPPSVPVRLSTGRLASTLKLAIPAIVVVPTL